MRNSKYHTVLIESREFEVAHAFVSSVSLIDDVCGSGLLYWRSVCSLEVARIQGVSVCLNRHWLLPIVGRVCAFTPDWYYFNASLRVWLKQGVYDLVYVRHRARVGVDRARSR